MTLTRRIIQLRRLLRTLPRVLQDLDRLGIIFDRLDELKGDLDHISCGVKTLDESLERLRCLDVKPVVKTVYVKEAAYKKPDPIEFEWTRLKLLSKFANLSGKAEEIERDWQKIQQDEHDTFFAFQVLRGQNENMMFYKKGIREGIQWCIDRFC